MLPIVQAVAGHAERHPQSLAVGPDTSYGALWLLVLKISHALNSHVSPRVLIAAPGSAFAYAAMIATLRCGGFYAPLNVRSPLPKQRLILDRFKPDIIVGTNAEIAALVDGDREIPVVVETTCASESSSDAKAPHELAYVIFTSGSTGIPKGVEIPQSALQNYAEWALDAMQLSADDRWSQHPNIGFDLSVLDIYGALYAGASLHPMTELEGRVSPGAFIRRTNLTIWNSVPSVIDVMVAGRQLTRDNLRGLRLMTFCGEPLLRHHLDHIFAAHPNVLVHNTYGPTEATVSCTLQPLTCDTYQACCRSSAALGAPIRNMGIHLVADGVECDEGEIVLTGVQLAKGYWQDEVATTRAFRPWSNNGASERAFYTNDWAARLGDALYFKERIDSQVKIGGHRLELEEVNSALRKIGAEFAASVVHDNALHAFIKPRSLIEDPAALRERLAQILEAYAVPKTFHFMEEPPYSANGKIDMKAIRALVETKCGSSRGHQTI